MLQNWSHYDKHGGLHLESESRRLSRIHQSDEEIRNTSTFGDFNAWSSLNANAFTFCFLRARR